MNDESTKEVTMTKEEFLLNYDVEQEQRELAPLAQALQDLARDCALVLPLFWKHLNALDEHNLDQPMPQKWPTTLREQRESLQGVVQVLNQLPQDQKRRVRDSITAEEFGSNEKHWIVPMNTTFIINGFSIPVDKLYLGLEFQFVRDKRKYIVEWCTIQKHLPQQLIQYPSEVWFLSGIIHLMDYQSKNTENDGVPVRSNGGEIKPNKVFWKYNPLRIEPLRIEQVSFQNEKQELSRENGPAQIHYTKKEDGALLASTVKWVYNGDENQGLERYKERLAVWQERAQLAKYMDHQEQGKEGGVSGHVKKKKL